jgi:hypothetical protein
MMHRPRAAQAPHQRELSGIAVISQDTESDILVAEARAKAAAIVKDATKRANRIIKKANLEQMVLLNRARLAARMKLEMSQQIHFDEDEAAPRASEARDRSLSFTAEQRAVFIHERDMKEKKARDDAMLHHDAMTCSLIEEYRAALRCGCTAKHAYEAALQVVIDDYTNGTTRPVPNDEAEQVLIRRYQTFLKEQDEEELHDVAMFQEYYSRLECDYIHFLMDKAYSETYKLQLSKTGCPGKAADAARQAEKDAE